MPEAIYLEDTLLTRLHARAAARSVSTEDFVRDVLASELDRFDSSEQWRALNGRRLDLIRKKYDSGLSSEEEAELRELQLAADHWLEAHDNKLEESVRRLEEAVSRLPPKPDDQPN